MTLELYLAGILLAALVLYALLGGADFGGGVWDALATGPRADDQRRTIARAIGPIWEANHIWLIAIIVLLFSCFPSAYSTISNTLHLPLTIMLFGIVLRGTAFVFRAYDTQRQDVFHGWSRVFAVGSIVTPVMLGICLGAAASGSLSPTPPTHMMSLHWLAPFPVAVGLFVLAVFAFLAAVYLTVETQDPELQDAFRLRALASAALVTTLAWAVFALAWQGAPHLVEGLWSSWWGLPFQLVTAALGLALVHALITRRFGRARGLATVQVAALVLGFGAAQYPYILTPGITFTNAKAPDSVLWAVAVGMTVGLIALTPAYVWLMAVFKGRPPAA